jgi:hypothetical protein
MTTKQNYINTNIKVMISIYKKETKLNRFVVLWMLLLTVFFSCKKKDIIGVDPYGGGKLPLGVSFSEPDPNSGTGVEGEIITVKVKGLLSYKGKFEFLVNEVKAEVTDLTDSTVNVVVPENSSTGGMAIVLDGQTFFGPKLTIEGKVKIDPSFKVKNGSNNPIFDLQETPGGSYIIVGAFTDFESKAAAAPVNRIAMISKDGDFQSSLKAGKGADGFLQNIVRLDNGKYMVAGGLTSFDNKDGIGGVTRLNSNGSLDSAVATLINLTPLNPKNGWDTVSTFNGKVFGTVLKTFVRENKITVIGTFSNYGKCFYERSTRDNKVIDLTKMHAMVRMTEDGSMDSTFNFNQVTKQSYEGFNGFVNDAIMQNDGKIVAVGRFTSFNGISANYIVRINTDGSIDKTFNIGTGADDTINSIRYNSLTDKIILTGLFRNFNGQATDGVVMIKLDGSTDNSFRFGKIVGGAATFAQQLNNGKVVVSGRFGRYNDVVRQGFMILNADGTLAKGYNNTGAFLGQISKLVETTSALGNPAILIVGDISKFDTQKVGNIVRIEIKP